MRVEYVGHMGSDLTVVNAARVSFDKESGWELVDDTLRLPDSDAKLIHYLATHNHFTPFTHCTVTLRETVPIFVARQRFKHMVGFSYNEVSRRYVADGLEFYLPNEWREAVANKKQGSGGPLPPEHQVQLTEKYKEWCQVCEAYYYWQTRDMNVCPEQARMTLPLSLMTSYYVTGSLAAFARAYKLRIDPHAQLEIQLLAKQWDEILSPLFPDSWKALTHDH